MIDGLGFRYSWVAGILVFNAVQAIVICYLRKQKKDPVLYIDRQSLFVVTADSKNFWQIRSLINKLEQKIDRI